MTGQHIGYVRVSAFDKIQNGKLKVSRLIELFYSFILTQQVMKRQLRPPLNQTFVNLGYP